MIERYSSGVLAMKNHLNLKNHLSLKIHPSLKNHPSLKTLLFTLLAGLSALCLLSACHGPQYKDEEKAELEKQGEDLIQAWLDGHMQGSKVLTAEADINMVPSGPHYLTDYVAGTLESGGKTRDYLVNTKTKDVYLIHDGELLTEVCLDYAFEKLGLESVRDNCRFYDVTASMWLPDSGNSFQGTEGPGAGTWLPGELALSLENAAAADATDQALKDVTDGAGNQAGNNGEDEAGDKAGDDAANEVKDQIANEAGNAAQIEILESFVCSPKERGLIAFGGSIVVPEEVDLEQYHMAYWLKQQEENGIVYQNLDLSDKFESISTYNSRASYNRRCFRKIEDPDIRIFMDEAYWVEKNGKDGIVIDEQKEYNLSDLSFEKTENGYLVTFPDYEHIFGFAIYADEGSEFLKHEYHSHEDREAYLSPGSKISGDKYFEYDLYWKEAGDGSYFLADEDGYRKNFYGGEELIPRD